MKICNLITILFSLTLSLSAMAVTNEEATALVLKSLENTVISSARHYCMKGSMTCRSMYQLKDKSSGKPVDVFYDTFYSAERQVGSTCYFIPTAPNATTYYVFSDLNFDGKVEINLISPQLAQIDRSFDGKDVLFTNMKMPKVNTSKYLLGKMIQSDSLVYIEGVQLDSNDSTVRDNVRVDYYRVNP
jgi:hypothetical protein